MASPKKNSPSPAGAERLQKVLAAAGVGSRRECETLIVDGRVDVDRKIVTELGVKVDPEKQLIRVDGEPVSIVRRVYFAVNKPPGVVSTNRDPAGRPRVIDLVNTDQRLFTIGRLDKSSEGLIIVTNDGEFANRLAHPRHGVEKTYFVRVVGSPSVEDLQSLKDGVHLAEGFAKVAKVKVRKRHKDSSELEIVLNEGRNREIRRLLARIGHKVVKLQRVAIGPLLLGALPQGASRRLTVDEIEALRNDTKPKRSNRKPSGRKKSSRRSDPRTAPRKSKRTKKTAAPAMPRMGAVLDYDEPGETPSTSDRTKRPKKNSSARGAKKPAKRSSARKPSKRTQRSKKRK